jgi:hypothetical protein
MFNANRSCAAPTLAECPEILPHSSSSSPIHRPTFLRIVITFCAVRGPPTPDEPCMRANIGPTFIPVSLMYLVTNRMVSGDKYAVAPRPWYPSSSILRRPGRSCIHALARHGDSQRRDFESPPAISVELLLLTFYVFPGSPATTSMSREICMSAWTSLLWSNPNSGAASAGCVRRQAMRSAGSSASARLVRYHAASASSIYGASAR